jgi:hypothetical protein
LAIDAVVVDDFLFDRVVVYLQGEVLHLKFFANVQAAA